MRTSALSLALLALLSVGCGDPPAPAARAGQEAQGRPAGPEAPLEFTPQGPELSPTTRIAHPEIKESSGIVRLGGAWWTHNDSGDTPRVFRSESLDFADAEILDVPDAMSADWEEMALFGDDLLICDVGDNLRMRPIVTIYRLKVGTLEKDGKKTTSVERAAVYTIEYPDGKHDCEGVFVADGKLHMVSKDRGEGTHVYRFETLTDLPDLAKGKRNVPKKIATLDLGDREQVTAADYDAATGEVVLLTYTQIARYPLAELSGKPSKRTWIAARQSEALCVDGKNLVVTNEQRDVYVIEDYARSMGPTLLPPRGRARLGAQWRDIPMTGLFENETLAWRLAGDSIEVRAHIVAAKGVRPTKPASGKLGTGLVLEFGNRSKPHITSEETVLFVGADERGGVTLSFLAFSGSNVVLAPVEGAVVEGAGENGNLTFEIAIPIGRAPKALFDLSDHFRFNVFGVGRGHGEMAIFSGQDRFAMYRPYIWGEVLVDR